MRTLVRIIRGLKSSLQTNVNYGLLRGDDITVKNDLRTGGQKPGFSQKTASMPLMLVKNPVSLVLMRRGLLKKEVYLFLVSF